VIESGNGKSGETRIDMLCSRRIDVIG